MATLSSAIVGFLLVLVVPVEEYGVYSYALALFSIGAAITNAGLTALAIKSLLRPGHQGATVVAISLIRILFAVGGYVVIGLISLSSGSFPTIAATLLAGLALFGRFGDGAESWFRSEMRTGVPAVGRIVITLSTFAVRIALLWVWPSIWVFIALFVATEVLNGVWILVRFLLDPSRPALSRPSGVATKTLLAGSMPLMLSGVANQVNLRGDIVILQSLLGATEVGIYSAAARMSEMAYFIPSAFMTASLPQLLKTRADHGPNHRRYHDLLQRSYDQAFWAGVAVALVVAGAGSAVIDLFLTPEFQTAKLVLWIHVAACPFVFMAAVYSKWIIAEGTLWLSLIRHALGAGTNIALNFILIPSVGIVGSAIATVGSYVVASYIACFTDRRSRVAAVHMTKALVAPIGLVRRANYRRRARESDHD